MRIRKCYLFFQIRYKRNFFDKNDKNRESFKIQFFKGYANIIKFFFYLNSSQLLPNNSLIAKAKVATVFFIRLFTILFLRLLFFSFLLFCFITSFHIHFTFLSFFLLSFFV